MRRLYLLEIESAPGRWVTIARFKSRRAAETRDAPLVSPSTKTRIISMLAKHAADFGETDDASVAPPNRPTP